MLDSQNSDDTKRLVNGSNPSATSHDEQHGFSEPNEVGPVKRKSENSASMASNGRNTQSYIEKSKYGVYDPDEATDEIQAQVADATPMTKRRVAKEEEAKQVKLLGPLATCFTIFKGFAATSVLYVPKDFFNGGYIFAPAMLVFSLLVTLYCSKLLLEVNDRLGGSASFPEMAFKAYGKWGKICTEIAIATSQFFFCTAYVYFIASQIGGVDGGVIYCITSTLDDCSDGFTFSKWIWLPICMVLWLPLVMVRRIEVFAMTHVFADAMIIISIIVIATYAGIDITDDGANFSEIKPLQPVWYGAIGFSVYNYEGVGVILPIREVTADKKIYFKLLCITVSSIAVLYISFGYWTMLAWGNNPDFQLPLITQSLPQKSVVTYFLKIAFSLNLLFSLPLMIHPCNIIVESWFFSKWEKTRKRQMMKNVSRSIILAVTCVVALLCYNKLDLLLNLSGSLACTPVAFIIPTALHLEVIAKKDENKTAIIIDWIILVSATIVMFYTGTMTIIDI